MPGLIIPDLLMPAMDGFAVVERLRASPATASIPIVILTSGGMDYTDRERLNGKISHLARKATFNRAEFVQLVHDLCPFRAAEGARDGSVRCPWNSPRCVPSQME
jgi:CheY-like chemotaxis protein